MMAKYVNKARTAEIRRFLVAGAAPRRSVNRTTRPPRQLPRALPPDVDQALMAAVGDLSDDFARTGLTVLRGAGLRIGELLDLELGCVVDYGSAGTWLRVPLGKLNSERSVPLDEPTAAALAAWAAQRATLAAALTAEISSRASARAALANHLPRLRTIR